MTFGIPIHPTKLSENCRFKISIVLGAGWRIEGVVEADSEEAAKQTAQNYVKDHYPQWVEEFKLL